MRKILIGCSIFALMPAVAGAAGTYYTGNYQSPQQRYSNQSYSAQRGGTFTQNGNTYNRVPQNGYAGGYNGYNNSSYASTRSMMPNSYYPNSNMSQQNNNAQQNQARASNTSATKGFTVGGGLSREYAVWRFEMKNSDSILRYDDVAWNVLDLHGAYVFDAGNMKLKLDAGFKYGMQSGEASMTDDDISNGGYFITQWVEEGANGEKNVIGDQMGNALSIGTSDGGNMYGFNVGFGLVDAFSLGGVKFTPSVGYRYFKYKLETNKNNGLAIDTSYCTTVTDPVTGTKSDEIQCDPIVIFIDSSGNKSVIWGPDAATGKHLIPNGSTSYDTAGTYAYYQPGTSHSYEVEWSGPYLAMDMDYAINQTNMISGRVELGFPGYTATGDQPYRLDWAHPKSVEDKADMFSAMHLGLGANWTTALTDMISLSLGVTYDYYTVSDADATTYLNENYYMTIYNNYLKGGDINGINWGPGYTSEEELIKNNTVAANIAQLREECPGWQCKIGSEIESFYRSLGIRLGLVAKF